MRTEDSSASEESMGVEETVYSLYSWSCASMSRVAFDAEVPNHIFMSDTELQYTPLWESISVMDADSSLRTSSRVFAMVSAPAIGAQSQKTALQDEPHFNRFAEIS